MKKNPIPLPNRIEAAVAASQGRMMIRRAAFCLACLMGLVVLYYCLVPALTQNGTADALYVFFDNGLSQYEGRTNADGSTTVVSAQVYENAEDADPTELMMHRLSDVIAENGTLWSSVKAQLGASVKGDGGSITIDNVNPANVFVSAEPVPVGQLITFSGWDSGTVHDTVTNYRINSASREWGYDYRDFQWTSPLMPLNPSSGVCFYASPQLMINRYAAEAALTEGGEKALVQMIWEHGDKKGDAYSKPEVPGAWVNPGTADGRTFYDAVLTMEGCFGDVNGAPNNFQIDDFTISYEKYKTADTVITNADFAAGTPADYGFDTVDVEGDNGGSLSVNSDGRLYSYYHQPAVYTLTADQLKAGNYHYSIDVLSTKWGLDALSVFLSTDNGNTGTLLQTVQIGADSADGAVHEISGDFTVPIGSSGVKLYFQTFNAWWTNWTDGTHRTDSAFYDNFVLQYEKSSYTEIPTAGAVNSSVTTSYTRDDSYAKDYADFMAVTLSDTNCVIGGNGAELFVCAAANEKGVVPLQGANTYSNKETYLLEGTAYSTDKVKIIARCSVCHDCM